MFLLFQMAEKEEDWSDWSDTEIDKIFNISTNPQNEDSEWDTEDLEPLMKITTFKHYLRLNLLRKGTERHKNIRKRRKILKKWYNRQSKKLQGTYKETTKTRLSKQKTEKGKDISHQTNRKSKQNARRKIANVCAGLDEFDDSGDDKTYSPLKCSNSSTESEDNTDISELIYKKEPVRQSMEEERKDHFITAKIS